MKNNYKYLGKKVKDISPKGLTHPKEVRAIMKAILNDYKKKRITRKTALGRLLLLYRLTFVKNNSKLKASRRTRIELRKDIKSAMLLIGETRKR